MPVRPHRDKKILYMIQQDELWISEEFLILITLLIMWSNETFQKKIIKEMNK